jgi:BirA family biotin operon repressor/biotin-[acetyl-CoA-carboxylase] ligase
VAKTLSSCRLEHVGIKWPNDVYIRDKKIAGILIETQSLQAGDIGATDLTAVVVGVGLNFDMPDTISLPDDAVQEKVLDITDINRELKSQVLEESIELQDVASLLLQNVVSACEYFQRDCKIALENFRAHYDYCNNKTVEIILDNQETLTGIAKGVNDAAELLVMIDGEMCVFNSADVSVKIDK